MTMTAATAIASEICRLCHFGGGGLSCQLCGLFEFDAALDQHLNHGKTIKEAAHIAHNAVTQEIYEMNAAYDRGERYTMREEAEE